MLREWEGEEIGGQVSFQHQVQSALASYLGQEVLQELTAAKVRTTTEKNNQAAL